MAPKTILLATILLHFLSSSLIVADNVLYSGGSLNTGQSLSYGSYFLSMQNDCNLVLYDAGRAMLATGTHGRGTKCRVVIQRDANLVVYNGNNNAVWASNTVKANGNYVLILQPDRNVVIYGGAIWGAGTNANGAGINISGDPAGGKNLNLCRKIDLVTNEG